jgi:hypothetical protein
MRARLMVYIFQPFHQSSAAEARKRNRPGRSRKTHINNEATYRRKMIIWPCQNKALLYSEFQRMLTILYDKRHAGFFYTLCLEMLYISV